MILKDWSKLSYFKVLLYHKFYSILGAGAHLSKIQHQVMIGLVQSIHGHMTGFNYHREASSSPPGEVDKNMVDEDRTI